MKHAVSPAPPSPAQVREQVEKILTSRCFSTSETVRNLLRYLGAKVEESPNHPKEHDIAITLLGRGSDYDPRIDPVVRVQTTRLRAKLAEYYISEGAADSIYIEIPKGSYMVSGSWRQSAVEEPEPLPAPALPPPPPVSAQRPRLLPYLIAAALLLAAASIAWSLRPTPDAALHSFWKAFASPSGETMVIYSNPKLVGSSTSGMRIYDPLRDQGAPINGGYTGAGEVVAMHAITAVITRLGGQLRPRRAQLFSWDDAKTHRLIFIGAPPHNIPLLELPVARRFRIKPYGESPRPDAGCVENLRPSPGEPALYCHEAQGSSQTEYALVTSSFGVDRNHAAVLFAGNTTFSTEAAVEFFCNPASMREVAKALDIPHSSTTAWPAFEAVIKCNLRGSVPVSAELVKVSR